MQEYILSDRTHKEKKWNDKFDFKLSRDFTKLFTN